MSKAVIGIDLGGTRIKSIALDKQGNILEQLYEPTHDGDDAVWKQATAACIEKLKAKLGTDDFVIGISAPGLPNEKNSAIAYMPGRLQGLENFDWSSLFNRKTWVLNDAVSAMMAEAKLGAAKDKKHAVLITLGTGVGGAILIDGKPYQGSFQKAGHIGHITLHHEGEPDVTGMPGSLEDAIGNCTIQKRSHGKFKDTHSLLEAYRKGDHFARTVWLTSVRKLAVGIACVTNVLSPEIVILAGGITEAGEDLFEPLDHFMALYEWRAGGNKTAIIKSQFGDMAGAIGAACFALTQDK
ncbi:MAG: ROK family protein [Bacteroidetes bacterium]|nr:ROK family protein [Bacteroidota bacterium]